MVIDPLQVARVSLLESKPSETRLRRTLLSRGNEVLGNVDSNNVSAHLCEGNGCGAISAAKVQDPQRRPYSERFYDCLSRLTHQGGNLGKVPFLPQCFVRIHDYFFLFCCQC